MSDLRARALKATPGPWDSPTGDYVWAGEEQIATGNEEGPYSTRYDNVQFIAACDPQTIIALLDAKEAAERERDELKHDVERTYQSLQGEMNARLEAERALADAEHRALERAAKVCAAYADDQLACTDSHTATECAAAIRALQQTPPCS